MRYLERKERAKLESFLRAIGAAYYDEDDEPEDDWLMAA